MFLGKNRDILNDTRVNEDKWGKAGGKFLDRKEKLKGQSYLLHKIGKLISLYPNYSSSS